MDEAGKQKSLRRYKRMATGLFVLMLILYSAMSYWLSRTGQHWMSYVQSFAEAAMVGALADWFAVTALFHHPLGIRIPHTNLIENSKQRIGDNLGNFVVQNFLNPVAIRPYIAKMNVASPLGNWLLKKKNQDLFIDETAKLLSHILRKTDDREMQEFISRKANELIGEIKFSGIASSALDYIVKHGEHQKLIGLLAGKIKSYVLTHEKMIEEKVSSESYFFVPKFIDKKLSSKITKSLYHYFEEIEMDPTHGLRLEITKQLSLLSEELHTDSGREAQLKKIAEIVFSREKIDQYAGDIWKTLKKNLLNELQTPDSALRNYFSKQMNSLANQLHTDEPLQIRLNGWLRYNGYRYAMRNREEVGKLISDTVGNWEGKELSRKLELEVGKDLQFIRVNGTLVGGLVGLLIHGLTEWLS